MPELSGECSRRSPCGGVGCSRGRRTRPVRWAWIESPVEARRGRCQRRLKTAPFRRRKLTPLVVFLADSMPASATATISVRNASVPTVSNPSRAYAAWRTSRSTRDRDPTTTAGLPNAAVTPASATQAKLLLTVDLIDPPRRDRDQRGRLRVAVARAEVLDDGVHAATRSGDLQHRRARPGCRTFRTNRSTGGV